MLPGAPTGEAFPGTPVAVLIWERGLLRPLFCFSSPSAIPVAVIGVCCEAVSLGVLGTDEDKIALPSSESASNSSGGNRSFSISDFRLKRNSKIRVDRKDLKKHIRIVKAVDTLFDVLCTGCKVTVGQFGGGSDALEL